VSAGRAEASAGFGELLRRRRQACGLSQEELGERSGLAVRTIANMERGRTARPHRRSVQSLADALALSASERDYLDRASRILPELGSEADAEVGDALVSELSRMLAVPRQLPATVPHFAGRASELRALTAMLDRPAEVCGTLVISAIAGTAGVGKTALAVHWAHESAGRFPDGQLYVNLRGYDPGQPMQATDALAGFLRALGVPGQDIAPGQDERAAQFRTQVSGRRMLIVLDNASDVDQVRPLLPGTPGCVTVVTSRDALVGLVARDGARRLDLDLLPLADAVGLLGSLIGDRVAADTAGAAELAARCCRLPLALRVTAELAAARPAAPLTELASELADQQRLLDLLDADGDPHTAVRAVFSWSCRHLDPAAARMFRLGGALPGAGLDAYAGAALAGISLALASRQLDKLARAYLIQQTGPGRYDMHDLLRGYACELAAAQDSEAERRAALTRLFDYYLHTAAAAMDTLAPAEQHWRPRITPPGSPSPLLIDECTSRAWLDAERASLVAATSHAAAHGWPEHASRLAVTLFRYLDSGGYFPEASVVHDQARRAARRAGDRGAEASALSSLGVVDLQQGRHRRAASRLQQALALCRESGDRVGEASVLTSLGVGDLRQGRYQQATSNLEQALAVCRESGDRTGETHALINLGVVAGRQGRDPVAADNLQQALILTRQGGDRAGEARVLANLAAAELRRGRHRQAAESARRSLAQFRESGNRHSEAYVLDTLGTVDLQLGHYQQAAGQYQQALKLHQEIGDRAGEAQAHNGLGNLLLAIGLPGNASTEYATALGLASQVGDRYEQARAHHGLARACDAAADSGQARHHWQQALAGFSRLGVPEAAQVRAQLAGDDSHLHRIS
jgi:tetratricopeptide (TPR) repeat protein/transcriptional regulator with XRE-family HTH domain